jgi:hypothetical protein
MASRSDPFVLFATQRGLQLSAEELCAAPRDVLAPPAELERYVLVALAGSTQATPTVRVLFVGEATDAKTPTMRDVLWWFASDSWAIEQANHDYGRWAALYKYPHSDPAAPRLFELHSMRAKALATLLGDGGYFELLSLYESEVRAGSNVRNIESLAFGAEEHRQ